MERLPVHSSNIASVGYDEDEGVLEVEFSNERIYEYYRVPAAVFRDLVSSGSPGAYLAENVKDVYQYRRIE